MPRTDAQNFAGALHEAGHKAAHRNSGGSQLPAAGSQPPPQPLPSTSPPPNPQSQAAAQNAHAAGTPGSAALGVVGAEASITLPGATAAAAIAATPTAALPATRSATPSTPPGPPAQQPAAHTANIGDEVGAAQAHLPPAAQDSASPVPPVTPAAAKVGVTIPATAKPVDSIKAAAANIAATSGRTGADRSAAAPATAPTDSTVTESTPQASIAAAAAQLAAISAPGAAEPADDLATPDTGIAPTNPLVASAPPVALPMAIAAPPKAPSAPEAAAAGTAAAGAIASLARGTSAQPHENSSGNAADAAQLLANSVSSPSTDVPPMPTLKVAPSVDSAEFGQGVADRVSLMMDSNLTSAKLQVNPPSLGPIEVRIALQAGHAQVWLTSHSAVTRDALQSGSSSLREMLGAQGFGQVSVDISQRSFQERSSQFQTYDAPPGARAPDAAAAPLQATQRMPNGILDAYA